MVETYFDEKLPIENLVTRVAAMIVFAELTGREIGLQYPNSKVVHEIIKKKWHVNWRDQLKVLKNA